MLADPAGALLAVDYDGVLAPIVADPTNSPPLPGAIPALGRLVAKLGSVAVISGRPAQTLLDYCKFSDDGIFKGITVFGHYGLQRWDGSVGQIVSPPPPPSLDDVRRELPELLVRLGINDAWIEDKSVALAVHTRRSADPVGALATLTEPITSMAVEHGLHVEPGRFVLEIRSPGVDKGHALRSFVAEREPRSVCYIGDDLGDLPAFDAVLDLRATGTVAGLTVASGSTEVAAVSSRADLVVDGPPGVVALLSAIA